MNEIWSEKLQDNIVILRGNESYNGPLVSYHESEFAILHQMDREELARIHDIKRIFGGKVKRIAGEPSTS